MPIETERIATRHHTADGFPLALTLFQPRKASDVVGTVVFSNATGVQARFYHHYAAFLSTQGLAAYTFDYRYSGASFPPHWDARRLAEDQDYLEEALHECPRGVDLTETWCRQDLASIVERAYSTYPAVDLTVVGHSLGGHLMVVLPRSHVYGPVAKVKRMLNVCGGNAYYENQRDPQEAEFGFTELVLKPLIEDSIFRASNLGLGYDLPYGPGREWMDWYFHPHFAFNRRENLDLARSLVGVELLYVGFEDDDRIDKLMMERYMSMLNHSDGLKRSLWVDPAKRSPRWPVCGHVNAFTKSKASESTPVEHGEGYAPKASSSSDADSAPRLRREETIWLLFLAYIRGRPLDTAGDEYRLWTPADERDVEKERSDEEEKWRGRASRFEAARIQVGKEASVSAKL
ncbi:uncharacterized protein PFL1_04726 [Pseudozyma flocculosa PF-1]|uniref:AB hydrolase-1 domain-containing protein n=2 Tax=Pseudozyma flocculosa TaxID=84751 RepID=A0A5C3F614_9BASI|nr:uncharacterized protein PFL1_04726 [Pseudozyma flocculosa PF-1]EPQ27588.1 hypothetical protein PFL1_04726 [Pseudozyma flocculosa PF-1]SPO39285.1 uncharacterized protein PSFLO_04765 [Pseudozyma flocculosa]